METPTPKPQPPKKAQIPAQETEQQAPVKKPFVPKEHLTHFAFREHEDLRALQKELNKSKPPVKRTAKNTQEKK